MMQFLHENAMQVSALLGAALTIVLAFWHPHDAAQIAALTGGPVAVGNFFAGIYLKGRNGAPVEPPGKGTITVTDPGSGMAHTVDLASATITGTHDPNHPPEGQP